MFFQRDFWQWKNGGETIDDQLNRADCNRIRRTHNPTAPFDSPAFRVIGVGVYIYSVMIIRAIIRFALSPLKPYGDQPSKTRYIHVCVHPLIIYNVLEMPKKLVINDIKK